MSVTKNRRNKKQFQFDEPQKTKEVKVKTKPKIYWNGNNKIKNWMAL